MHPAAAAATESLDREGRAPPLTRPMDTLSRLEATIRDRLKAADGSASYVAALGERGTPAIARKIGEEAVETIVASLSGSREDLVGEAADLLFHLLVLLAQQGVTLADVLAELDRREGVSGLAEKAARSS
jgi:phosphoribosyl-ATP pyrophosphohydrolase